jgi:hypothetical protein
MWPMWLAPAVGAGRRLSVPRGQGERETGAQLSSILDPLVLRPSDLEPS